MFVTIYGRGGCPYCVKAKALAEKLKIFTENFNYEYIDINEKGLTKEDLSVLVGRPVQTVPQIFIDEKPIGGCTDFQVIIKEKFDIEI